MKRIKIAASALMSLVLASTATLVSGAGPANALPTNAAVFFSPHQDDEILFMGAAIHEHVKAGRPTYVVLLTDGGASGLCKQKFATRAQCTAFRDAEFKTAVKALGATPIIPSNRMPDGATTVSGLKAVMLPYKVKGHSLKTMSWEYDAHKDHLNAGAALKSLNFTDSRYYLKADASAKLRAAGVPVGKHPFHTDTKCMAAVNAYRDFGWLSVPTFFNVAKKGLLSEYRTG